MPDAHPSKRKLAHLTKIIVTFGICLVLVIFFILAWNGLQTKKAETAKLYGSAINTARTEIWRDINSGKVSSADVAVMDNGKVVYSEGFGMGDREKSTPIDTTTLFNMGSVSKSFVAAVIMKLVDEGKVNLDAPVTTYIPEFKMADPRYKDITVKMLLDHTSGLPGTTNANNFGYTYNDTIYKDTLQNLSQLQLRNAPGQTGPYTNDGFTLAEMIVSRVSGQKYIDFLTQNILQPLSLSHTGLSVGEKSNADIAYLYQSDTGKKQPAEVLSVLGAGGLSSTAEDLVKFIDSFAPGAQHILSDKSIQNMLTASPSTLAKDAMQQVGINPEMQYGLGFDVVKIPSYQEKGINIIGKGGDTDDYHTMMISVPDKRISVAVMEAGSGGGAPQIAFDVLNNVLESKGLMQKEEKAVSKPTTQNLPTQYQDYSGYYCTGTDCFKITFDVKNNTTTLLKLVPGAQQVTLTYKDGAFDVGNGTKFNFISVDGKHYMLMPVDGGYMVMAQQVLPSSQPKSLGIDITGKQWLRRNVKPFEALSADTGDIVTPKTIDGLPGYINFLGVKKIISPTFAGMAMDGVRDQTELTLLNKNGQTWIQNSDMLYSPSSVAIPLQTGKQQVTIGNDGYNQWLNTSGDLILSFDKPVKDRVIVFATDGTPTYDSVMDKGDIYVPTGSYVEFAGNAGDTLKITAKQAK